MNARILLISGNPLCRNPRVLKEATCLAAEGHAVEVLGAWYSRQQRAEDKVLLSGSGFEFTPVVDLSEQRALGILLHFLRRTRARVAQRTFRATRIESKWQLGVGVGALARAARKRAFDLAIAHSEPALAVAEGLRRAGGRVGVDLEDWYSEDLPAEARRDRPVALLRVLESRLLRAGYYASCPSTAMSEAVVEAVGCPAPSVVYNAFPWSDRAILDGLSRVRCGRKRPSVHWYSQTLGAGRGLEDLFEALPHVRSEAEVHLRGQQAEGFGRWLAERTPETWRERVFVHSLVPNDQLLSRIVEHDIGFAGEMKHCRSRDLTVTNKILHYLLAGLAVVASDTAGQMEIARQAPGAVTIYPSGDARALAARLDELLVSGDRLRGAQAAALAAAESTFNWERQQVRLVGAVQAGLEAFAGNGRRKSPGRA